MNGPLHTPHPPRRCHRVHGRIQEIPIGPFPNSVKDKGRPEFPKWNSAEQEQGTQAGVLGSGRRVSTNHLGSSLPVWCVSLGENKKPKEF